MKNAEAGVNGTSLGDAKRVPTSLPDSRPFVFGVLRNPQVVPDSVCGDRTLAMHWKFVIIFL